MHPEIAVICHAYYPDLARRIASDLWSLPRPFDIYLSTPFQEHVELLRDIFAPLKQSTTVTVVPNRGRDIAPKLITYRKEAQRYQYVLYTHTKASDPQWAQHAMLRLAGAPHIVDSILGAFKRDPRLGIVAHEHYPPINRGYTGRITTATPRSSRRASAYGCRIPLTSRPGRCFGPARRR